LNDRLSDCYQEVALVNQKSKSAIIQRLHTERKRLEKNLVGLSPDDILVPGVVAAWSVKDILAHLAEWESFMPVWIDSARRGEVVETPAPGLTWKQLDILNQRIYETYRDVSLEEVMVYFQSAHHAFMRMAETMPENEMLERGLYDFIGGGAVCDWLSAFAAHDLWAKRKIRQWLNAKGE
jgi:hypothetical protein